MNTAKKIIAVITVVFVVIRLFMINVSASFAAPVMAEETLKTILIEGMLAGGADYTKDDLEAWELEDLENEFEIQMTTNPNFKPKEAAPKIFPFIPFSDTVLGNFLSTMDENGAELYDFINPTYSNGIDMNGGTAVVKHLYADGSFTIYYSNTSGELYYDHDSKIWSISYYYFENYDKNGKFRGSLTENSNIGGTYYSDSVFIYGSWKWRDSDTPVETDDVPIPVIGEADGTQVTPDMLNPDGTVTIDGTTYSPSDYIDWEKFKDNAIIDLLNDILAKIDSIPVVSEQDKPNVDTDSIEVTLPEELSDFAVPIGIANFFPFSLPWDFVRGIKMLLAKPEVPVFKTEIDLTDFCGFNLGVIPFEISLEKWEPAVVVVRWFFLLMYVIVLIILTPKICKGA